jgi:hypothetical protein
MTNHKFILQPKVDQYFKWLIDYGHEAASMWAQGNVEPADLDDFRELVKKDFHKHGFKT